MHSLVGVACHYGILVPNVPSCHIWNNGNHVLGSLLCQLGAVMGAVGTVLGGCRWCVTIAVVAGVGHLPFVLADGIHKFGAVGDLFSGMLDGKVVHSNVSQLMLEGVLNGLAISLPRSFPSWWYAWMISAMQYMLTILIIDHLAAVHQYLDACDKILGVLSWPGYNIFEFSKMYMGVDMSCVIPCWIWSRKAEAFAFIAFCSSLHCPVGIHCACISSDLVPRAAKMYLRWSLLSSGMQLRRSQFSRVWQNMEME